MIKFGNNFKVLVILNGYNTLASTSNIPSNWFA